jgi:hypothetical protein
MADSSMFEKLEEIRRVILIDLMAHGRHHRVSKEDRTMSFNRVPMQTRSRASCTDRVAATSREVAMHPEFPIERVCSHVHEPFQLTFARNARQHFCTRDDVDAVASHLGLTMRGETEDAIDAAIVVLKDLYGPKIHVGPPTIRYHRGGALEQPWMGMRIQCATGDLDAVNADLVDRNAMIAHCELQAGSCLIQACAPLASLLGYRAALQKQTAGAAQYAMWLSHYAPVETPPPDGRAA